MRVFPGVPFGGYKQSGYGRELGMETMRLYTETKSVLTYYRRETDGPVQGIDLQHMDEPLKIGRRVQHDVRDALERWNVLSTRHRSHGRRLASRSRLLRPLSLFGRRGAARNVGRLERSRISCRAGSVEPPSRPLSTAVLSEARDVLSEAEDGCHLHLHDDDSVNLEPKLKRAGFPAIVTP